MLLAIDPVKEGYFLNQDFSSYTLDSNTKTIGFLVEDVIAKACLAESGVFVGKLFNGQQLIHDVSP